jgi:HSP20 family protein
MTLVKWNRGNRTSGSTSALSNERFMPSATSPFESVFPGFWEPFSRPMFSRDLIQDFFDDALHLGSGAIGTTLPAVNINETDTDIVIEMAAPGMRKNDFKVEVNEDQLHIAYVRKQENENNNRINSWRREFNFESFERTFTLPAIVESDKIYANYTDGILRISIPKKEEARRKPARSVEIK